MIAAATWLDRHLGRLTMYALMIVCLVSLAVISLLFTIFGALPFSPLDLSAMPRCCSSSVTWQMVSAGSCSAPDRS